MGADGTVPDSSTVPRLVYPVARRDESVVDDHHGVKVPDPYRWLEQEGHSPEVAAFMKAQVELTEKVFAPIQKESQKLRRLIMDTANHPRYRQVWRKAGRWIYYHNTGLQPHDVVYCCDHEEAVGRHGESAGEPKAWVLVDPNGFSEDNTVALHGPPSVSEDGKYAAYMFSAAAGDWCRIRVVRVDGGGDEEERIVDDSISWVKFTEIAWTHDSKGFFYVRWKAPNLERENGALRPGQEVNPTTNAMLCYHFLGTDQSEDVLCWEDSAHPNHYIEVELTDDGRYLLVYTRAGSGPCKMQYCDLSALPEGCVEGWKKSQTTDNNGDEKGPLLPFVPLVDNFEARVTYVANDGSVFILKTNKDAPMYKLVRVDLQAPDVWETLVEESDKSVLEAAHAVKDKVLIKYLRDAKSILQVRDLSSGKLVHQIPVDIGNVSWITNSRYDPVAFFGLISFLNPGIIYRCDLSAPVTPEVKVFREIHVSGFDRNDFEVKQVFAPSKDGTKIPMFIMAPKGIVLDGSNPVLMHGYGGFNISPGPTFSVSRMILAKHMGVVFCSTNLRGGGEYGEAWHNAGKRENKQNVFDDFIACAEYVVSLGYTSPGKICIEGASNGGLLIGATVNQRPDLYGCAFALGGPMDMLRYHKFTLGHYWMSEYGCPEKEEDFHWLIKYSPLHTVKRPWEQESLRQPCQYPSTMMFTADHDDRVVPLHSLKQIATLQHVLCTSLENSPQTNPIFCRILMNTGHGAGASTQKQIDEAALRYSFMAKQMGITWRD